MPEIKKPRGTKVTFTNRDIVEIKKRIIIDQLKFSNNFWEIEPPIFEYREVFEDNDLSGIQAQKEFFYLKDRKENPNSPDTFSYVLRPEYTAAIVRWFSSLKKPNTDLGIGYFYCGPCFRYERPQLGRWRQFTQIGFERFFVDKKFGDIESIQITDRIFQKLEITSNLELHINYLGTKNSREKWSKSLSEYFEKNKSSLSEISQKRIHSNPMRILDDINDKDNDIVKNSPKLSLYFDNQEIEDINRTKYLLRELNIDFIYDEKLVRGIDYYSGFVYEWIDKKTGLTIAAGGSYDEIFKRFNSDPINSSGVAIGWDRLVHLFWDNEYPDNIVSRHKSDSGIFFLADTLTEEEFLLVTKFLNFLRDAKISISSSISSQKINQSSNSNHFCRMIYKGAGKLDLFLDSSVEKLDIFLDKEKILQKLKNNGF